MKKLFTLFVAILMLAAFSSKAQVITTSPKLLQEASKDVVLTFHADQAGVAGLKNLPSTTKLYAHIGVLTNLSNGSWAHVVADWGINLPKNTLTYVSANTYQLSIGDLRTYFGITDENEHITKICFIARTATGDVQTKDLFIDVHEPGFQLALTSDAESLVFSKATTVKFTADVTDAADITITANGNTIASASGVTTLSKDFTISSIGFYDIVATAVYNGQTYTKSLTAAWPTPSTQGTYPGGVPRQGAVRNADGTVTFCLAAPGKTSVVLIPSWNGYVLSDQNVMKYQDYQGNRYFWITVSGLNETDAYPYYYLVDGMTKVGDPYAHLVLDCYSDKWLGEHVYQDRPRYPYDKFDDTMLAVYKEDLTKNFSFSKFDIPDHKNLIIYELLLRDFTGTDATDDGTIAAAIEKIPYLKSLGVNCIELLPVMEFNGNNSWGYNTNFYFALDKSYGSPRELQQFVELCHRNGMAVVLDIVFNQSDGLHPWYQMYPIASNPFYNEEAPHSWSVLNDWKQDHALVKQQWTDAIRYWMTEYNVDGFRFDLVKGLGDNSSYASGTDNYNQNRVDNMKKLHEAIMSVKPNGIHINELLGDGREDNALAADGQLCWNNVSGDANNFAGVNTKADNQMMGFWAPNWNRTNFHMVSYAESHDEERNGYSAICNGYLKLYPDARYARLGQIAATMLMTPGPKMIWQFAELGGDESTKKNGENNTDPKLILWDRLNDENAAALLQCYQELNWVRRRNPQLFESATVEYSRTGFANTFTNGRVITLRNGSSELILLMNPSQVKTTSKSVSGTVKTISAANYQVLSKSPAVNESSVSFNGTTIAASIPGNSYILVGTKDLASVDEVIGDDLGQGNNVSVIGGQGEIIINGDYNDVQVYTIAGQSVGSLTVPAGLYIVNVDGKATKVLVK